MNYDEKEIEQLLMIASYHKEIARRKLASQLVLTLGENCSREKVMRILAGEYQNVTVRAEQLEKKNLSYDNFYVMQSNDKLLVVVSSEKGEKAEVFADYGSGNGILSVGKEMYQTMEGTVYELEVNNAEEIQIIVYTYPVEYTTEWITEKNI